MSPFTLLPCLASDPCVYLIHDREYVVTMWIVECVCPRWSTPRSPHLPQEKPDGWEFWGAFLVVTVTRGGY